MVHLTQEADGTPSTQLAFMLCKRYRKELRLYRGKVDGKGINSCKGAVGKSFHQNIIYIGLFVFNVGFLMLTVRYSLGYGASYRGVEWVYAEG
jgi:hypothetical protein